MVDFIAVLLHVLGISVRSAGNILALALSLTPVIVGGVLALSGNLIIERSKEKRKLRAVKTAVSNELREVAYELLGTVYQIARKSGGFNRDLLEWMLPRARQYEGPNRSESLVLIIENLLKETDEVLAKISAQARVNVPATYCPRPEASYTTVAAAQAHDFDPDYAVDLLDILSHLRILNDEREASIYWTRLTFVPGLEDENHDRANKNASVSDEQIAKQARLIIDRITKLEKQYS